MLAQNLTNENIEDVNKELEQLEKEVSLSLMWECRAWTLQSLGCWFQSIRIRGSVTRCAKTKCFPCNYKHDNGNKSQGRKEDGYCISIEFRRRWSWEPRHSCSGNAYKYLGIVFDDRVRDRVWYAISRTCQTSCKKRTRLRSISPPLPKCHAIATMSSVNCTK